MLTVDEARVRLAAAMSLAAGERVALADALGRVSAASSLRATHDVPPFANSAMDGFAVRAEDGAAERRVVGESRAGGVVPPAVERGTAVPIMTGAPIPAGADAVVPIEDATESDGLVTVARAPSVGAHVRDAGHDVPGGAEVPIPGGPVTAAVVALLAAMGHADVLVRRRPRVALLSTGDELVDAGAELMAGQIHDANGPALAAAVREAGGEPITLDRVGDDAADIESRLREGAAAADLIVVSGGVSVGAHDHVRGAIERLGTLDFWRIAVQPGKPLAFGRVGETPVVGLPGHPVSALVTFELFVRPMLRTALGLHGDGRARVRARVDEAIAKDRDRRAYLRVRVCADGDAYRASSAGGQASSQLLPLATANALLVVPEGIAATRPGESYEAIVTGAIE